MFTPGIDVFQFSLHIMVHYALNPTKTVRISKVGISVWLLLTAGPGSPGMPLSPRCPGIPTIPLWPVVPAGPGGPSGPWNSQEIKWCYHTFCRNNMTRPNQELVDGEVMTWTRTYRLPIFSCITLVSRTTRGPSWSSITHTTMRTRITTKTWGTFFSWLANRPSRPWSSLIRCLKLRYNWHYSDQDKQPPRTVVFINCKYEPREEQCVTEHRGSTISFTVVLDSQDFKITSMLKPSSSSHHNFKSLL